MKRISIFLIIFTIINTGLLHAQQETPVVNTVALADSVPSDSMLIADRVAEPPILTKALRDSIQEHLKLVRRFSTNTRSIDIKAARRHMQRVLFLSDSLLLSDADYLTAAGDLEDLAFNYERNKPALGGKTDQAACLASAKQCYLYYQQAFALYRSDPDRYGKNGVKQQHRIQQLAMQYYLLTNGFQVNAGQSFQKGDLETTLQEFLMTLDGSHSDFLLEAYLSDTRRFADFATYQADSTQCRALFNCATLYSALGDLDASLACYDSLKVRSYEPDKVHRNVIAIHTSRSDTLRLISELNESIAELPSDTWYQKNLLQIYLDLQEWREAERLADLCYATDSTDAVALAIRGQLYEMDDNTDEAMACYLRSYALDSTQCNVCSYIGRIHYNRAVSLKKQLYDQRKFKQIDHEVQPIYDLALPWYERAFELDAEWQDHSIPVAIRDILYSRFTKDRCRNRAALITHYNEVSRAYGLPPFGS